MPVVQKFLMGPGMPTETAVRVYKRYLRLEPTHAEEYIAYLKSKVPPALNTFLKVLVRGF